MSEPNPEDPLMADIVSIDKSRDSQEHLLLTWWAFFYTGKLFD